jgi:NAD(P)-dependent dehydrogenase (short-subunit alcohol dehydrogenase family)
MDAGKDSDPEKVLLVTGASRGIGAAIARAAGRARWRVAVNYARDFAAAERVVADIEAAGGRAVAVQADVAREEDVMRLFAGIDRRFGRLDGLVNNAGVVGRLGRLDQLDAADLRRVFEINTFGAFLCAREAVRRMSTAHGGRGGAIVNISSAAATIGSAGEFIHYAASKAALNALTLGLAREVAREGIRVNAIEPGLVETDMHEAIGGAARTERLMATIAVGRAAAAAEIAAPVLFLLSDAASYIVGAVLKATGGR